MAPVSRPSTWTDACFTLCNTTLMFPPALCLRSIFRAGRSAYKFYIFAAGITCLNKSGNGLRWTVSCKFFLSFFCLFPLAALFFLNTPLFLLDRHDRLV